MENDNLSEILNESVESFGGNTGQPLPGAEPWGFPGWGTAEHIEDLSASAEKLPPVHHAAKLGVWEATAICGNDITSSVLYVAALSALFAGPYAPLALLAVAAVLFLFRGIYAEVGTALPLNGGAYNVLLNTTTKAKAAFAACLTLLSYVATAVISANEAMHYAHNLFHGLPVIMATVCVLAVFALLAVIGMGESAKVALGIFLFHLVTLTLLSACALFSPAGGMDMLITNFKTPPPVPGGNALVALFFGFSAAMLGISGFESSANFIEEQKPGVFPKTLTNMWLAVAIFNPLISLLAMRLMPLEQVTGHANDLLAEMGLRAAGPWLQGLVSIDAVMVLCGAVLTSYVGVTGLVRRMSLDRCLPEFLLQENRWRGTNHWIILLFFLLCWSILAITHGEVTLLAGVYTLSFLGVMALFAVGNMLLKMKRNRLPRQIRASWPAVAVALVAVCLGIVGNVLINPSYVRVFLVYAALALLAVMLMFLRVQILRVMLIVLEVTVTTLQSLNERVSQRLMAQIRAINTRQIIFFTKDDDIALLNAAAQYVLQNEQNKRLRVVHCYTNSPDEVPPSLAEHLRTLDVMYPQLRIDFLLVKGIFSPELINQLSQHLDVPKNYMFIGTPGDRFPHSLSDLGGVRLIM